VLRRALNRLTADCGSRNGITLIFLAVYCSIGGYPENNQGENDFQAFLLQWLRRCTPPGLLSKGGRLLDARTGAVPQDQDIDNLLMQARGVALVDHSFDLSYRGSQLGLTLALQSNGSAQAATRSMAVLKAV